MGEKEMVLWWIVGVLVGVYVLVFGLLRRFNYWYYVGRFGKKYNLPPGDMGWPLIGTLLPFLKAFRSGQPDSFTSDLVYKYGQTGMYKTFLFGSPSVIVFIPEVCRQVLMNDEQFIFGYSKATRILTGKRALNTASKPQHRRLRRLIASLISGHDALSLYIGHVEHIVIKYLDEWGTMKEPIEFLTEMKNVAFKVLLHIFIGSTSEEFIGKMEILYTDFHLGFMATAIDLPGTTFSRALKARNELIKIFQNVLNDKKKMKSGGGEERRERKKDMTDLLLEVRDEDGVGLDDECIIDLLIGFFFAGHETSAHSIMRAIMFMSENPEILEKAKAEQREIVKERPREQEGLTMKEIKRMDYLSKVIDETLRKTSLAFTLSRETKVDVSLNGYTIPKGWKILVWTRAVHMDPNIYEEPQKFNPSRWENQRPRAGSFIPFGAGMRLCPGIDLSKLEIAIFLHYFLLGYKFERINPRCPENHLPLPRPTDNCLARVLRDPCEIMKK